MNETRHFRTAGIAGLAFVVLLLGGFIAFVATGPQSKPGEALTLTVVRAHGLGLGALAYLWALAGLSFLVFALGLGRLLRRGEPEVAWYSTLALAGGAIFSGYQLLGSYFLEHIFNIARQEVHGPGDEIAIQVLIQLPLRGVIFDATWIYPAAVLVGATGLAGVGSNILPRRLAAASTWFAVLLLAMAGVGFLGPLDRVRFLTLPIFLIWIIAVSVALLRVRTTSPPASRTAQ
jgi:hypothetical protein